MSARNALVMGGAIFLFAGVGVSADLTPNEELGKSIFFDQNLSSETNLACVSCHGPAAGWTGPLSDINAHGAVYEGSIEGRFGNRKPPSAAYATLSPIFHFEIDHKEALFIGGNFWDGRATGEKLGNPAADQAQGPFLNPLEQALPDADAVVTRICGSTYSDLFTQVCGAAACDDGNENAAYDCVGLAVAGYEGSPEVNAFSSKYDLTFAGKAKLTQQERRGYALFRGKAKCSNCHIANGQQALFTDFTYDNLGVPRNPENPFYDADPVFNPLGNGWIDLGLGGFLASRVDYQQYAPENYGKVKVPTLRNVNKWDEGELGPKIKAYAHNGYFKTLEGIVHFYNTRDVLPNCEDQGLYDATEADALANDCWPPAEVTTTVNKDELGDLGLSSEEEADIVAFVKTLSDGYEPEK
jgi:cytochrome c peroxidase